MLLLGDGDFSFGRAVSGLARATGCHLTITSLDTAEAVEAKYAGAAANLAALRDAGAKIVHGVDATKLAANLHPVSRWLFDVVSWNFPYPITRIGQTDITTEVRALMKGFFGCVGAVLAPGGTVRLVLSKMQGGTTREVRATRAGWNIESVAEAAGFELVEVLPFSFSDFPVLHCSFSCSKRLLVATIADPSFLCAPAQGYESRREFADTTFPSDNARTHVFARRAPPTPPAPPRRMEPDNVVVMPDFGPDVARRVNASPPPRPTSAVRHAGAAHSERMHYRAAAAEFLTPNVSRAGGALLTRAPSRRTPPHPPPPPRCLSHSTRSTHSAPPPA